MSAEIKMSMEERRKYLLRMRLRDVQGARAERSRLLSEMEAVTGLHRKSLLRLMQEAPVRKMRQRQRGRSYGPQVEDMNPVVVEILDYICAERLTPTLAPTARLHLIVNQVPQGRLHLGAVERGDLLVPFHLDDVPALLMAQAETRPFTDRH